MSQILKMVRRAKLTAANILNLLIQGAEAGAATATLLTQAHNPLPNILR